MFQTGSGVEMLVCQGEKTFLSFVPGKHDRVSLRVNLPHLHHVEITGRANMRYGRLLLEYARYLLIHQSNFHDIAYKHPLKVVDDRTIFSFVRKKNVVLDNPVMGIKVGKICK